MGNPYASKGGIKQLHHYQSKKSNMVLPVAVSATVSVPNQGLMPYSMAAIFKAESAATLSSFIIPLILN